MSVVVTVGNKILEGFESGSVNLTMLDCYNSFEIEYVTDDIDLVNAGDTITIALGDDLLLEGFVDTVEIDDEPDRLRCRAIGRSKTADLTDCSAPVGKKWTNAQIVKIVGDLCSPFDISTYVSTFNAPMAGYTPEPYDPRPFPTFSVQKGETIYDAISRAAIKRKMFIYCVGGDLVIGQLAASFADVPLMRGRNLISTTRTSSWVSRYSDYIFKGQARSSENNFGSSASQLNAAVQDSALVDAGRYRPLLVVAEAHDTIDLKTRATFEMNHRRAGSDRIVAVVDGLYCDQQNTKAWRPNTSVMLYNSVIGISGHRLILSVRMRFGASEPEVTELELCEAAAFRGA